MASARLGLGSVLRSVSQPQPQSQSLSLSSFGLLFLTLTATAALAQDRMSGSFASKGWSFDLGSAVVFPGEELVGSDPAIVLALTNASVNLEWLSGWKDKRWVLDHFIANTQAENPTLFVYAELDLEGRYSGLSWYFGPGDGCGYCSSGGVTSTLKLAGGRLVGKLEGTEDSYTIAVDLDIPLLAEAPGERAANDSPPARALLAFHTALASGDHTGLWEQLDVEWHELLKERTPEQLEEFYAAVASDKLPREITIKEVWIDGDRALVVYEGVASYGGKLRGEVRMDREGDAWKYDDAWVDVMLGE